MAVEYATTLKVLDAPSGAPASLTDVARRVSEWAEIPALEPSNFEGVGRNGGTVVARLLDVGDSDLWGWSLSLEVTSDDRSGDPVDWTATVLVVESRQTTVSIRVERVAHGEFVRPLTTRPKPPLVVRALLDSDDLRVVDGNIPLRTLPVMLSKELVADFVDGLLLSAERRLPVVAASEALGTSTALVNPDQLASDLAGIAHVWLVPSDVSWHLSDLLTKRLSVYNGAIRVWWPGLSLDDSPFDHPLWMRRAGADVENEIVDLLTSVAASRFGEPAEIRELETRLRRVDDERLRAELDTLLELATAPSQTGGERDSLEESIRGRVTAIEQDRDGALDEIVRLEGERDGLQKELGNLKAQLYGLRARLGYREAADPEAESNDLSAEDEFLAAVTTSYETRFTLADRERYPLVRMKVGRHFLATLEQIEVPASKVADVCAEIACRRVNEINGRQTHQLRASDSGNAPPRRRAVDGATAWRCYLENRTPSAARIHWWAVGDEVEFAAVGPHDFMEIPE